MTKGEYLNYWARQSRYDVCLCGWDADGWEDGSLKLGPLLPFYFALRDGDAPSWHWCHSSCYFQGKWPSDKTDSRLA